MKRKDNPVFRWHSRKWLLVLLCGTLLAGRVDGAHLHLCLDGQEQPSSLRLGPDTPSRPGTQAPHDDRDLALAADLLVKPGKGDLKQPLALPTADIALLFAAVRFDSVVAAVAAAPSASSVRLPPLRGPPDSITT